MGDIVPMRVPAKRLSGSRRNVSWVITYLPALKRWSWEVTVQMQPQTFRGEAQTQAEAQQEVDKYLRKMTV